MEDPALEGAPTAELQRRFRVWARADRPDVDMDDPQTWRSARHEYFLKIDGEGLWGGYVGLVRGWPVTTGVEDWMKIPASLVGPEFYYEMGNIEMWYVYYTEPERGVATRGYW